MYFIHIKAAEYTPWYSILTHLLHSSSETAKLLVVSARNPSRDTATIHYHIFPLCSMAVQPSTWQTRCNTRILLLLPGFHEWKAAVITTTRSSTTVFSRPHLCKLHGFTCVAVLRSDYYHVGSKWRT